MRRSLDPAARVGAAVILAGTMALPAGARAGDGGTAAVGTGALDAAIFAVLILVSLLLALLATTRRRGRIAALRHRALAEQLALAGSAPAACFHWRLADGRESYVPAALDFLDLGTGPTFEALLLRLPSEAEELRRAVAALRGEGRSFALGAVLAGGAGIAITGQRARAADGRPVADAVWISDAS